MPLNINLAEFTNILVLFIFIFLPDKWLKKPYKQLEKCVKEKYMV